MVDSPLQIGGPGKFSVREDLPPSQNYGDRKAMAEDIAGASTSPKPSAKPAPVAEVVGAAAKATPLVGMFAPTQRKDEDVMTMAGPPQPAEGKLSDTLAALLPYDQTGEISVLYQMALSRGQ
jgi:hypothetical protein